MVKVLKINLLLSQVSCKDGERGRAEHMPPRDIVHIIKDAHVLIVPATGSAIISRERDSESDALYLSDKSRGLELDRLVRVRFAVASIVAEVEIKLANAEMEVSGPCPCYLPVLYLGSRNRRHDNP